MAGTAVFSCRAYRLSAFPHRHLKSPHLTCKSLTQKVTIGKGLLFHSTHVRTQTFRTPRTHTHIHIHMDLSHVFAHVHTHTRTKSHIPALLCVEGLLGTLTLGTEWSRSSPRLMCAHTLLLPTPLALTHRPPANPLLQRSHPSISQRGLLRGARSLGLS